MSATAITDEKGNTVAELAPGNDYSTLVYSSPELTEGVYTLWNGEQQLAVSGGGGMGGRPGMPGGFPGGGERPERPGGMEGFAPPEGFTPPEGWNPQERLEKPQGEGGKQEGGFRPGGNNTPTGEVSTQFTIVPGANYFTVTTG